MVTWGYEAHSSDNRAAIRGSGSRQVIATPRAAKSTVALPVPAPTSRISPTGSAYSRMSSIMLSGYPGRALAYCSTASPNTSRRSRSTLPPWSPNNYRSRGEFRPYAAHVTGNVSHDTLGQLIDEELDRD